MEFKINKKTNVPYYSQIIDNIKKLVEMGYWVPGTKLPTERELAERLGVSRNTVSMAYKELETEGYIECYQGRGTFISKQDDDIYQSRKERLLKVIDSSLEEALQLGFTMEEFLAITHVRAREKQDTLKKLKLAFIECNQEQINYFVNDLKFDKGVSIIPILLSDLITSPENYKEQLSDVDVVITTFFHLDEIKEALQDMEVEILPIALELQLETVVKIARLPVNSKVGLVCKSKNFAHKFMKSLTNAGINHVHVDYFTGVSEKELVSFIRSLDQVITSPGKKEHIRKYLNPNQSIVEVIFKPDQASLNLLKSTLIDLKQKVS